MFWSWLVVPVQDVLLSYSPAFPFTPRFKARSGQLERMTQERKSVGKRVGVCVCVRRDTIQVKPTFPKFYTGEKKKKKTPAK